MLLIALYLSAIVAANLFIAAFGPAAVAPVSFFLVGFTLTSRNRLHELWRERLVLNLGLLIAAGGFLSALLNLNATRVAIASVVAFTFSQALDTLIYEPLYRRQVKWFTRSNTSNLGSAVLDSLIFVSIAFGFSWPIIASQVAAKVLGGLFWTAILNRRVTKALGGR